MPRSDLRSVGQSGQSGIYVLRGCRQFYDLNLNVLCPFPTFSVLRCLLDQELKYYAGKITDRVITGNLNIKGIVVQLQEQEDGIISFWKALGFNLFRLFKFSGILFSNARGFVLEGFQLTFRTLGSCYIKSVPAGSSLFKINCKF